MCKGGHCADGVLIHRSLSTSFPGASSGGTPGSVASRSRVKHNNGTTLASGHNLPEEEQPETIYEDEIPIEIFLVDSKHLRITNQRFRNHSAMQ